MDHTAAVPDQDAWHPDHTGHDDIGDRLVSVARLVERRSRGRLDLATRHMRGVTTLLATRDDLRGVYAFADVVEEAVRWSA